MLPSHLPPQKKLKKTFLYLLHLCIGLKLQFFQLALWKYKYDSMVFFQGKKNWEILLMFQSKFTVDIMT